MCAGGFCKSGASVAAWPSETTHCIASACDMVGHFGIWACTIHFWANKRFQGKGEEEEKTSVVNIELGLDSVP